jgi:short chain dehydrogenase
LHQLMGEVAVIAGAASGIGFGLAERFVAEGAKVVLADIEEEAMARTERSLRSSEAELVAILTGRVLAGPGRSAGQGRAAFGAVHVACNNAGVSTSNGAPVLAGEPSLATRWSSRQLVREDVDVVDTWLRGYKLMQWPSPLPPPGLGGERPGPIRRERRRDSRTSTALCGWRTMPSCLAGPGPAVPELNVAICGAGHSCRRTAPTFGVPIPRPTRSQVATSGD